MGIPLALYLLPARVVIPCLLLFSLGTAVYIEGLTLEEWATELRTSVISEIEVLVERVLTVVSLLFSGQFFNFFFGQP